MAPKFVPKGGPRKSNGNTPIPGETGENVPTLADKLNYADIPRPFKATHFISKLPYKTASSSTTQVKKNVKQILTLERERVSGGDGFLSAAQTAQRARGEEVEIPGKKKKSGGMSVTGGKRGYNLMNLKGGKKSGLNTPSTIVGTDGRSEVGEMSRRTTPDDGEGEGEDDAMDIDAGVLDPSIPLKEIITYHTPTAPPSLLPPKKYCDITGLHASYTDPRTKLRYKGLEVWGAVRNLGPGGDQAYLSMRGAQTSLK